MASVPVWLNAIILRGDVEVYYSSCNYFCVQSVTISHFVSDGIDIFLNTKWIAISDKANQLTSMYNYVYVFLC